MALALVAASISAGCDSGLFQKAGAMNAAGAATGAAGPGEFAVISGILTLVDDAPAVQHQGNNYYIKTAPALPGEGTALTITGEAAPILGQDAGGDSLFFGYSLTAEKVSLQPENEAGVAK
jgi:hypothetical protein